MQFWLMNLNVLCSMFAVLLSSLCMKHFVRSSDVSSAVKQGPAVEAQTNATSGLGEHEGKKWKPSSRSSKSDLMKKRNGEIFEDHCLKGNMLMLIFNALRVLRISNCLGRFKIRPTSVLSIDLDWESSSFWSRANYAYHTDGMFSTFIYGGTCTTTIAASFLTRLLQLLKLNMTRSCTFPSENMSRRKSSSKMTLSSFD